MEFVIVWYGLWEKRKIGSNSRLGDPCISVHSHDALKGRPRVLRTAKPLFMLPRGSTLRSSTERLE